MTNAKDFIFDQVYKGALKAGASDRHAKDEAVTAMDRYKKNRFGKASKMIEEAIKDAVKHTKKEGVTLKQKRPIAAGNGGPRV